MGIHCAGCGGTRMIFSVLKLDFYQAFRYNPGMFILMVILGVLMLINIFNLILHKNLYLPHKNAIYLCVCLLFFYMIIRNMPGFEFLLPTTV